MKESEKLAGGLASKKALLAENFRLKQLMAERERALGAAALMHSELKEQLMEHYAGIVQSISSLRYEMDKLWQGYQSIQERLPDPADEGNPE
jgi:hypothetical protein